jgi:cysteine desulfurase
MHSNNELGVINDIPSVAKISNEKGILLHTDAVQSLGKTELDINNIGCNTASFSAHKIYGPKGIGALYIKKNTVLDKLIHGGKQERDRRGGTENTAAVAGFKKSVQLIKEEMDNDIALYKKLKDMLVKSLTETFKDKVIINSSLVKLPLTEGAGRGNISNIVNISFDPAKTKIDPDTLLIRFDMNGIAVSSGSACTSGTIKPSHVLKALGYDDDTAKSSLRISFGRFNKESDVDNFVIALKGIINP